MSDDPFMVLGLPPTATAAEIHAARRRLAKTVHPDIGGDADTMQAINAAASEALSRRGAAPPAAGSGPPPRPQGHGRVVDDRPAFTIEALPAEAFEALLVVTAWIGEVISDDPPYLLEVELTDPVRCWCRLDLLPEAGSSSVGLTIAGSGGEPAPEIDTVRDLWIRCLNELDWDHLDRTLDDPGSRPQL